MEAAAGQGPASDQGRRGLWQQQPRSKQQRGWQQAGGGGGSEEQGSEEQGSSDDAAAGWGGSGPGPPSRSPALDEVLRDYLSRAQRQLLPHYAVCDMAPMVRAWGEGQCGRGRGQ